MDILIKGMEMPEAGGYLASLVVYHEGSPSLSVTVDDVTTAYQLVDFPARHGRLIDADRLLAIIKSAAGDQISVPLAAVLGSIEHAPIVVEKEGQT